MTKTYAERRASNGADFYGNYQQGELKRPEVIAGRIINEDLPGFKVKESDNE